jgi:rare lipoprotein A
MANRSGARPAAGQAAAALVTIAMVGCAHAREAPPTRSEATADQTAATMNVPTSHDPPPPRLEVQVGYATWYGQAFAGRRTASGERFDPRKMTAAHRSLSFGTWVEVKRIDTGDTVRVRITDRGPFGHEDRIIDLSRAAAERLGVLKAGLTRVEVRVVEGP